MHEEGDSDVDEFGDERTEAMEQAIFNFIAETPHEFIDSDEDVEDFCATSGGSQSQRQLRDNLVKDRRR